MYFYKKSDGSVVSCYKLIDGLEEINEEAFNERMNSTIAKLEKLAELHEQTRPLTADEVTAMLIRQQINTLTVDDQTALRMLEFYPEWATGTAYPAGHKVQHNGKLYKCLQAHTAQADWNPVDASSLWAEVLAGQDGTAIGEWVQPDSTNPYMRGDRVTHNGKTYESEVDNNVWEPGVYGWVGI